MVEEEDVDLDALTGWRGVMCSSVKSLSSLRTASGVLPVRAGCRERKLCCGADFGVFLEPKIPFDDRG